MANQEHVDRLKQGVEQWNAWREQNREIQPDLSGANLGDADLRNADLSNASLSGADLGDTDLSGANLSKTELRDVGLSNTNLIRTNLNRANLGNATLYGANLNGATLSKSHLGGAKILRTIFANVDLSDTKGLTEIRHDGPSIVQLHTIKLPQDGSALHFLRGSGVPDEWIDFWRSTMMHPIQYHSLFISYSSKDETLARRLHADLQASGVRCWFAPEDMKIGDKMRARIDEAIHFQDKLLLILSAASVASDWVEREVEMALAKEHKEQRTMLFPIRVDRAILDQEDHGWPVLVRHQRHIGDFSNWANPQAYQIAFKRLLRDLKKVDE